MFMSSFIAELDRAESGGGGGPNICQLKILAKLRQCEHEQCETYDSEKNSFEDLVSSINALLNIYTKRFMAQ